MSGSRHVPRVLVVDDEPMMRRVIARELLGAFEVVEAANGAAAIAAIDECSELAAVITDFDLGRGESGLQVLDEARRRRPAAARILVSGRAQPDEVAAHLRSGLVARFVQKPWTVGVLRDALGRTGLPFDPADDLSDEDLVRRARAGDAAAMELIMRAHGESLSIMARGNGVAPGDVEDLLQAAYQRLVFRDRRIRTVGGFLRWTMKNLCRNYHRDAARKRTLLARYVSEARSSPSPAPSTELRFIRLLDAKTALTRIGRDCLEIITALVIQQRPYAEFALATGMARNTVSSTLLRCLRKARDYLADRGYHLRLGRMGDARDTR